jgi:hypothetical protein
MHRKGGDASIPLLRRKFPAVSNIVSGIRMACSVAVSAVLGRFTVPRTFGLNIRSSTTTNTIPMPSVSGCDYSKNANHAPGGGRDRTGTLPLPSRAKATNFVAEVLPHSHTRAAHNAQFSSAYVGGDNHWNIPICRDIPSDFPVDLTFDNARVYTTESSFGNSHQRPVMNQ